MDITARKVDGLKIMGGSKTHDKALASLRLEIGEFTDSCNAGNVRPRLSAGEMAVMAIVCSKSYALDKRDIMLWILKNISEYREDLIDQYISNANENFEEGDITVERIVPCFRQAFEDYSVPLREDWDEEEDEDGCMHIKYCNNPEWHDPRCYTVSVAAARIFLASRLNRIREGKFRFLDLPAELRELIYEFALTFPESGIGLSMSASTRNPTKLKVSLAERIDGCAPYSVDWLKAKSADEAAIVWPAKALAVFLTCKQVYNESMPIFYRSNTFHFYGVAAMYHGLTRLSHDRLQALTSITLVLDFMPAIRATDALKAIKELRIAASEWEWLNLKRADRACLGGVDTDTYKTIGDIPGFAELAALAAKAENIVWLYDGAGCKNLKEYVEEKMEEAKVVEELAKAAAGLELAKRESTTSSG